MSRCGGVYVGGPTGIQQDLWVARKDGLFLRIAADDSNIAESVAKVAIETIP